MAGAVVAWVAKAGKAGAVPGWARRLTRPSSLGTKRNSLADLAGTGRLYRPATHNSILGELSRGERAGGRWCQSACGGNNLTGVRSGPEQGLGAGRARRAGRRAGQSPAGILWQDWPRARDGLQAERLEAIRTPRLCRAALSRRRHGRYSMKIAGAAMSGGISAGDTPKTGMPHMPRHLTVGRSVAQPGSALASGARGREFESPRSDQYFPMS